METLQLVVPSLPYAASYRDALLRGFSYNTLSDISQQELVKLDANAEEHLALMNDKPNGRTITLPSGEKVPRLPSMMRWLWDGEFAGSISFRYMEGTNELPPYVLGHIGYVVPEWKRGKGYATEMLRMLLPLAKEVGVSCLALTVKPENIASQKVITNNGGALVKEIVMPEYGNTTRLLFSLPTGDINR